jgi:RNA polymerase sigma-70 factor, ECF subfamily
VTATTPIAASSAAAFVGEHQQGLWRWLRALGCSAANTDEHCQDALLAALHHGVDRWPAPAARRWLRVAARNLHWMQLRRERRRPGHLPLPELEAQWTRFGGDDDGLANALQALAGCVQSLRARDRQLVDLRYETELGRDAIGERLGLGAAGVKQALRRLRDRLRRCVERKLGDVARVTQPGERP